MKKEMTSSKDLIIYGGLWIATGAIYLILNLIMTNIEAVLPVRIIIFAIALLNPMFAIIFTAKFIQFTLNAPRASKNPLFYAGLWLAAGVICFFGFLSFKISGATFPSILFFAVSSVACLAFLIIFIVKLIQYIKNAGAYENSPKCKDIFDRIDAPTANTSYFSLITSAQQAKTDEERISYLEQALSVLPQFVMDCMKSDGELPPVVPPRDTLPELYMRYGNWEKARETVDFCSSVKAFQKSEYADMIELIDVRQAAAEGLLDFLNENPGFIQKNVYKEPALSAYNHDALVWVCRSFKLIRKEKSGNTNKLYCA